ncbi:hypothetical protein L207DRAFT_523720 [Hyaloscypha variabilis F]|uniref:Uncharacterized protein n=1 Tax=Hyaloscypha variabilis (strain UAMH 11265 / GT02V1 / F) TaxID=1149755 RepID=A0A2J6S6B3_HYAVF|nr:hypothetical protein L207DRAFT_523720 [Hyaloscypha variabilis F]
MSALRDAARRRLELNPLTTSLGLAPQAHQTPNSAISSSSLSAPFGYNPSTYTPVSAARPYNPQQWLNSPSVASDAGTHHSLGRVQDTEVVTPAPPPYSPPRSQRISLNSNDEILTSPAARLSPANLYRSSPEPISNPTFPPPPSSRTRAGSNDRPPAIFNISTFSRRTGHDPPRLSPEATRENAPAVRRPVPISVEAPSSSEEDQLSNVDSRPPASRRAASTGAISTPSSSRSRGSSTTRWEPGMPLPPPPPGPPPQSRSQSMTRTSDHMVSPPTRRPPHLLSNLGPIPPTPAGWVDGHEDISIRGRSPSKGLHIDTESASSSTVANDLSNSGSSSSGLARTHAVRGEPKSIRERRTESKTRKATVAQEEPSNNPWAEAITPSDIVVPPTVLSRRPTITRSTPRSARFNQVETPQSGDPSEHATPVQARTDSGSRGSTPRPPHSSSQPEAPAPQFSPAQLKAALSNTSPAIPPKALPTPPQSRMSLSSPGRPSPSLLYIPTPESAVVPPPLVPSRPGSRQSSASQISQVSPSEQFARAAIERHQAFAQKEAAAKTDSERVRIFAEFIVTESRLRRDKYAGAIDAMGSEILDLTRDLFRPYNQSRRESSVSRSSGWTPDSSVGPKSPGIPGQRSHRGSLTAALHDSPHFPKIERSSSSGPTSPALARPESTWWSGYMPSLSPIPSMSVSEAPDGSDSRGRPSSRWWELSQEGRSEGAGSQRLERSKRESKYMGMPRELREALQYDDGGPQTNGSVTSPDAAGPSEKNAYGPNEYPPEKVGLHEQDLSSPALQQQTPSKPQTPYSATPITPNPNHVDVSRLVTLPPPYPRHHPAVNNNHPDLTSIRTIVRVISDFTEVEATKSRFQKTSLQIQDDLAVEASKRRNSLRLNIQREIEAGNMSFADAAKIEATAVTAAQEKEKEASKVDFELFQKEVVIPLNDLLMDRVARSTELFTTLRSQLFVDAQEQSPNLTQEEGDEQPELLEKLTLLKWIFEAREQLHRELFDLLSDRNNRYRDMVITPYRLAKNEEKIRNAETFFKEDASKRQLAFEQDVLKRTEEFMDIIEENVKRGVEVQLSAFWDIAPSLSRITEKIPKDLTNFQIQIPASEYEENPSYHVFPMQYLYSMLEHCEKSTYQFIESQTNLLCLLHEVKSGVTVANCRLMRTQRIAQGEDEKEVDRELKEVENDEEVRLTDDLKERVRCVEEQWGSSLGNELKSLRDRIMGFLMEQGGWDEDQ